MFPLCELLRTSFKNDLATIKAGFWSNLYNMIGILNDVGLVLDDKQRVANVDEAVEDREKFLDVAEMKSGRGLI